MQTSVGVEDRPRGPAGAQDYDVILMLDRWSGGLVQESCGCLRFRRHFGAKRLVWGPAQESWGAQDFDVILMQNRWGGGLAQESCGCL